MTKHEDISIKSGSKAKVANSASKVLLNLDRYMEESGYGTDHPWCVEIASAAGSDDAAVDAAEDILMVSEMVDNLVVLAILGTEAGKEKTALFAARRYIADIDSAAKFLIGSAA